VDGCVERRGDGLKVVETVGYLEGGVFFGVDCVEGRVSRGIADEEFH